MAWSMRGITRSSTKRPRPVTCRGASLLRTLAPTNGILHRLDNLHVASAHAQVAGEIVPNVVLRGLDVALQQGVAGHHESRRAEAALQREVRDECLLDRRQRAVARESFDG